MDTSVFIDASVFNVLKVLSVVSIRFGEDGKTAPIDFFDRLLQKNIPKPKVLRFGMSHNMPVPLQRLSIEGLIISIIMVAQYLLFLKL